MLARKYVPRSTDTSSYIGPTWRRVLQQGPHGEPYCYLAGNCEEYNLDVEAAIQVYGIEPTFTEGLPMFDTQLLCARCWADMQITNPGRFAVVDWPPR